MKHAKNKSSDSPQQTAEFKFGYTYRTIEETINRFAAEAGNPYSLTDIADRISGLLRYKAIRSELGDTEPLQEVRGASAEARTTDTAKNLDVVARSHRTLSAAARKRIGAAQRKRWAKQRKQRKPPTELHCKSCNFVAHSRGEMTAHYNSKHRIYKEAA